LFDVDRARAGVEERRRSERVGVEHVRRQVEADMQLGRREAARSDPCGVDRDAALAARYRSPFVVFAGSALALWTVCAMAVLVGHHAAKLFDPAKTKKVAALLFLAVGAALIAGAV
ncbi:MAG: TMEM165/GDT1 family protein, partial [Polyangiaceae bacterium]